MPTIPAAPTETPVRPGPGDLVAVALSGGVDSALTAHLLARQGLRVVAVHALLVPDSVPTPAQAMADRLGLDLEILDLTDDFERLVIRPFVESYAAGRTPSPCLLCNPLIKFGLIAAWARARGIPWLATGHYAALAPNGSGLIRGRDRSKDQTYFLSRLTREQLARVIFPLATLTKAEVKARAAELGWAVREESQEVCFLSGGDYREFLRRRLEGSSGSLATGSGAAFAPGEIVDTQGRVLGRHQGVINYTVGQRRGLNLPGPEPYYVLALEPLAGRVLIGTRAETLSGGLIAGDLVWSGGPAGEEFRAGTQIRSRHSPVPALVRIDAAGRAVVRFDQPQSAVTPGQAVAFYQGDALLGGGWIEEARRTDDGLDPESSTCGRRLPGPV